MEKEVLKFIDRLFRDLYLSPELLRHSTGDKGKKFENIELYMRNMEEMHKRAATKESRIKILKQMYYAKYVIRSEDIPESYYKLQEQIALERGYGHVRITEADKRKLQEEVIENQKRSLDIWLDYFLSEDSRFYPFWAKYWAFQGMLKLGSYDKSKGTLYNQELGKISLFISFGI